MKTTPEKIAAAEIELAKAQREALIDVAVPKQAFRAPFSVRIGFHDGVFVAVDDAAGQSVCNLRDIEGAACPVRELNLSAYKLSAGLRAAD